MSTLLSIFPTEFTESLVRFLICIAANWFIIDRLYFKKAHRRDFYFTFMIITVAIFFLVYFMMGLDRGKATMGVGLGLFGIFSIMRYRTDSMPVREMTYLFVVVCLSVIHALDSSYKELLTIDLLTIVAITICELRLKIQCTKLIQYDRIELIKPERYEEMKADLEERTGLKITKIDVGGIDFLKDTAVLRITYESTPNDVNGQFKVTKPQWREV